MVGVPQNAMGFQYPHSGSCYAGFFLFSHGEYREYLQTPLTKELKKAQIYCLSMYVSLANHSSTYIDQLGFCFLPGERHFETADVLDTLNPIYIKLDKMKADTAKWHRVKGRYKAKGGEKFMLIGSFNINKVRRTGFSFPKDLKTPINKSSMRDSYYFIDDVSLCECPALPSEKDTVIAVGPDTLKKWKAQILRNILFHTASAELDTSSFAHLDTLAMVLVKDGLNVQINGYTDDSGSKEANKKLSAQRAQAVKDYLIKKGVSFSRISTTGYGADRPLVPNDTEEHRAMNRRVEVVFVE